MILKTAHKIYLHVINNVTNYLILFIVMLEFKLKIIQLYLFN
jgi:hypothetical protein